MWTQSTLTNPLWLRSVEVDIQPSGQWKIISAAGKESLSPLLIPSLNKADVNRMAVFGNAFQAAGDIQYAASIASN